MITLTFNYSKSHKAIDHTEEFYLKFNEMENVFFNGYNNHKYFMMTAKYHPLKWPIETLDNTQYAVDVANMLSIYNVPQSLALQHAPAHNHFDLWDPFDLGTNDGLYMRVKQHIPPPPAWTTYVLKDYYESGPRSYNYDYNKWTDAIDEWGTKVALLIGRGHVTHADLKDLGGKIGTIDATGPVNTFLLTDIASYRTIVYGSKHNDTIEAVGSIVYGGKGNDILEDGAS
jgi:hypothetical protein